MLVAVGAEPYFDLERGRLSVVLPKHRPLEDDGHMPGWCSGGPNDRRPHRA
ncbi:MAG: hypothetical protein ACLT1W_11885 [Alistipes onderdonkii]